MKLKYYIRGVGIGVVVTTLILTIAFNIRMQDNVSEPTTQGSTSNLDNILSTTQATEESTEISTESTTEATSKEEQSESASEAKSEEPTTETIQVVVNLDGFISSEQVCDYLVSVGIVGDANDFNNYLGANGYAEKIWPRTYTITKGSNYETIAKIICGMQ